MRSPPGGPIVHAAAGHGPQLRRTRLALLVLSTGRAVGALLRVDGCGRRASQGAFDAGSVARTLLVTIVCSGVGATSTSTTADFEGGSLPAGWTTGGGSSYAWTQRSGGTPSWGTGPSSGHGGSGSYVYAETDSGSQGDEFMLSYDGTHCASLEACVRRCGRFWV